MKEKVIHVYGGHYFFNINEILSGQMKREYFPVVLDEVPFRLIFHELYDNPLYIGDIELYHTHLLHPALSLGFRLEYKGKVFVYATDNELIKDDKMPEYNLKNIRNLINNADVLVAECQYTDTEYTCKVGWGHSTIESVMELAKENNVKRLYTFHHDPYHNDFYIDGMIKKARRRAGSNLSITGAREGMVVTL